VISADPKPIKGLFNRPRGKEKEDGSLRGGEKKGGRGEGGRRRGIRKTKITNRTNELLITKEVKMRVRGQGGTSEGDNTPEIVLATRDGRRKHARERETE